jgi:hypothetical protein
MGREQAVRELAYAIWEANGCPDGRADEHWCQAEAQIDAELAQAKNFADRTSAAGKPVKGVRDGRPPKQTKTVRPNKPENTR